MLHKSAILEVTAEYVKSKLLGESSGHDWWHIYRVVGLAKRIAQVEGADLYIVQLAALLHDIADWKFHNGDETAGPRIAAEWLAGVGAESTDIEAVCEIIQCVSYKGANTLAPAKVSIEGAVVQDADRLDAIGAIGVARAFAYGGFANRVLHDPAQEPILHSSFAEYKASRSTTINHFYEKLFLVKDRLNTPTARSIAEERHKFMEDFVKRFFREWEGEL